MAKKREKPAEGSGEEICAGCDARAPQHPWIGVMHEDDVDNNDSIVISMTGVDFVGVAVCDACHRDPTHRQYPLKCHFHPRATGKVGVLMAGSADIGM